MLVATLVTVLVGAGLTILDRMDRRGRLQEARVSVASQVSTIRAKLEFALTAPLLRAKGVVAHIVAHGGITRDEFEVVAEVLLKDHKNVRNMVVSQGLVITMTYPLAGNEAVIGVDFRDVPIQYASVRKAIESHNSLLQGPVPLIQGGTGLILRTPVFLPVDGDRPETFYGMANMVLDIPATFADAGLTDPDLPIAVAIRGRDGMGAAGDMVFGDATVFDADPVVADVQLGFGTWRIAAVPKGGWDAVEMPLAPRVMALLAFVAMATIAFGTAFHIIGQRRIRLALHQKSRDLEAVVANLERSNGDLERFAYLASHDLQTPLRNVTSYAQLLARRYRGKLDADADTFIAFIVDGSTRMSQMIHELLEYARVSNSALADEAVAVRDVVDEALANLAGAVAEAGAVVEVGTMPRILGNRSHLVSLFQNVIGNAVKYRAEDRPPRIRVEAREDAPGWWRFAVTDNGIGIDPAYFDQIFTVFQRLHVPGDRDGTGIGLALCDRIVRQAGGRLWVESTPGLGATFLFTLPAAKAAEPPRRGQT